MQVYRFRHWLADKADYKCSFKNKGTAGFECRPAVAATPAGPEGSEVEVEVVFEPTAVGEGFRDVLVLSSPAGGEYECAVVGRCLPPKPQGPIEMVKVRDPVAWALANLHYFIRSGFPVGLQWAPKSFCGVRAKCKAARSGDRHCPCVAVVQDAAAVAQAVLVLACMP